MIWGFVGVRPEVAKHVDKYTDEMNATLLLPAGITSPWVSNLKTRLLKSRKWKKCRWDLCGGNSSRQDEI